MTRYPVTVDSTDTVQAVADAMFVSEVRHIPIVRHGMFVGIVELFLNKKESSSTARHKPQ
jgi:CBS domain-containing protein